MDNRSGFGEEDCDSVEGIADSDLEDGELQKMMTSPLYAQKASGKPDAMVVQEREVSAQYNQANRKEGLTSHPSEGQKALGKPNAFFSSEQRNLIRSSVFRKRQPAEFERISPRRQRGSPAQPGKIRHGEARTQCRIPKKVHR